MDSPLPAWFQAEQIFSHEGRWYFGSRSSLHVGPYDSRATARARSAQAVEQLRALHSHAEQMRFVRKLLREEWDQILLTGGNDEDDVIEEVDLTPPPMQVRQGESQQTWFRSSRFFSAGDMWFFSTREHIDVGPFESEADARKHERRLVKLLTSARTTEEARRIAYEYKHRAEEDEPISIEPLRQFHRVY